MYIKSTYECIALLKRDSCELATVVKRFVKASLCWTNWSDVLFGCASKEVSSTGMLCIFVIVYVR